MKTRELERMCVCVWGGGGILGFFVKGNVFKNRV